MTLVGPFDRIVPGLSWDMCGEVVLGVEGLPELVELLLFYPVFDTLDILPEFGLQTLQF